ncbi:MAG: CsbD family protein [Kibdelosporangium sp.]
MSANDKPKHLVEEIVGKIKEEWGEHTGNEALRVQGEAEADQAKAELEKD